ncbi:hypothetical protein MUA48_07885 [Staphylococcus sp. IVB6238]|uniref:hypothetical protein n=1 Tax=Staphylococcus sp. IVB6238 TaxID=2989770 RepID=UPI0021D37D55|nr:hypothetical protein [Staphylococcus sp. IVB6238]UXR73293.1 hypothetical protein MUA48_07885 [Staphylococcus sp. IVB6238]
MAERWIYTGRGNRENVAGVNANFKYLFDDVEGVWRFLDDKGVEVISSEGIQSAISEWLADNKLKPKEPVSTFAELPSNPELKEIRLVEDTNTQYIYDGLNWVEFGVINADGLDFFTKYFRIQNGNAGSESTISLAEGYEGNAIINDVRGALIGGGGAQNSENVIGSSDKANIGQAIPNTVNLNGTGAHYASILAGYDNINNALAGIIIGFHCYIDQKATHGAILSGSFHEILDGDYAVIVGGTGNIIDVVDSGAYAFLGGGLKNTISGKYGAIVAGMNNVASGEHSLVIVGNTNKATAYAASVLSGFYNEATGDLSTITGEGGKTTNKAQQTVSGGYTTVKGARQKSEYVLSAKTTARAYVNLGYNQTSVVPKIEAGYTWLYKATIVARSNDLVKAFEVGGVFSRKKDGTTQFLGNMSKTVIHQDTGTENWDVSTLAGTGTFNLRVIGDDGKTIEWVADVVTTEIGV